MIASYIFAYLQGGNLPYSVFYGFLITFVLALLSILLHRKKLFIDVKLNKKIYSAGESDVLTTIVQNNTLIAIPYVSIKNNGLIAVNSKYNGDALNIKLEESKWIKHEITFKKRGVYDFGEINIQLKDTFCIFEINKKLKRNALVKVYPRIFNIERSLLKGSDIFKNAASNKSSIEDMYSTRDIRKYRDGDNLKRINWKVSAKYNELFVREFETVSGQEFNVFLDMSEGNNTIDANGFFEQHMIDFAASLINHMVQKEIKTKVFINASRQQSFDIESKFEFDKLMDFFLTQKSDGEYSFLNYLNGNAYKLSSLSGIGVITSSVNEKLTETLMNLKDRGFNILLFYSGGEWSEVKNISLLNKVGVDCYNINNIMIDGSKPGIG
jgi:hypothetical protein